MKKILFITLVLVSTLGYSQQSIKDLKIRNKLTVVNEFELADSSAIAIATDGDTLATIPWVTENAAILTGNNTEIFYNSGGVLGSSPLFTYNPLDSTLTVDSLLFANGQRISWNVDENTINIPTGLGSVIQAGQELQIKVYNQTGSFISDGTAVYPNGTFNDFPTIGLAQTNTHNTVGVDYGLTTTDVDDDGFGFVVWFGKANNLNTNSYDLGDTIWISSTNAGEITNEKPMFPNFAIQVGIVMKVDASDGIIFVTSRSNVDDTFINFYNGTIRENFDFRVTATGDVITGTLSPTDGHPDLTLIFSDGFTIFDTSPGATITLTAGTNNNPQMNYVYIPKSTKLLTVSISGFPTTEHKAIAKLLLKSADFVEKYKATINQNINDPIANTTTLQGQLSNITKRIRLDHAKHISGTEGVSTIETGSTPDDVWVSVTEGKVSQLNEHTFPAFDSQIGDSLYISNHFVNPDTLIGNLNELLNDALGNSLNNTSFSFVAWGVINKTGEPSLIKINLPAGSYAFASPQNAVSDALNYSVYSFPTVYTGVGFLIARFTYTYKNDDWVLIDTQDLTGFTPNTTAGGGASGTGVTTFLGLTDTESSYTAYEFQIANAGGTALESPSGITYNDSLNVSGNIIGDTIKASGRIGIGISNPLSALHINKGFGTGTGILFNSGSEIYESTSNNLRFSMAGGEVWRMDANFFGGVVSSARPAFRNNTPTAIIPDIIMRTNDSNTGFGSNAVDQGSGIAGGKEIFRWAENVTEQFIINPQGDFTGTAAAPNFAFGGGGVANTGVREISDNLLLWSIGGANKYYFGADGIFGFAATTFKLRFLTASTTVPSLVPNRSNENTGVGGTVGTLSLITNAIEAMRLTEDTVFIDSILKVGKNFNWNESTLSINNGNNNVFVGNNSGNETTSAISNTFIGSYSGGAITTGNVNTGLGYLSGGAVTNGTNNVFLGYTAGRNLSTGDDNVFVGLAAGFSNNSNRNVFIGYNAGYNETGTNKLYIESSNSATPLIYGDFLTNTLTINDTLEVTGAIKGVMQIAKAQLLYTNTSQTAIVTLPINAVVWDIAVETITLFDDSGVDLLDIGTTGSSTRYVVSTTLLPSTGFKLGNKGDFTINSNPDKMVGTTNITFQYTPDGTPTQGEAWIYIHYTIF